MWPAQSRQYYRKIVVLYFRQIIVPINWGHIFANGMECTAIPLTLLYMKFREIQQHQTSQMCTVLICRYYCTLYN